MSYRRQIRYVIYKKACEVCSSVHTLSKETIYLAADNIKCSTITVLLHFSFFLSQKKPLQPFATEMLHKRFHQHQELTAASRVCARLPPQTLLTRMLRWWKRQWWHTVFELIKRCRGRGQRWLSLVCHVTDDPWPALLYDSCQLNATLTEMPPFLPH